jgi:hypothetical protein
MSDREREGNASDPEHVGAVPAEDAESAWLRARRRDPGAPPPSPALVREHAQLEDMMGNLPAIRVDDSWHDDVLNAAIRAHRRTTRRRWAATVLGAAAVMSVIWLWPAHRPRDPRFDLWIEHPHGATRGGEATIGDHLMVRARLEADSDLRVYRDRTTLLAWCPRGAHCSSSEPDADEKLIDLTLDLPGEYDVLMVAGAGEALQDGPMDAFLAAARSNNARVAARTVDVR